MLLYYLILFIELGLMLILHLVWNLIIYLFIFKYKGLCSLLLSLIWILMSFGGDFDGLV